MSAINRIFPLPWALAPREGKHYGTLIMDADGDIIMKVWSSRGNQDPSEREKAHFRDWTIERWHEYCCNYHYETVSDYEAAKQIVEIMNARAADERTDG